MMSRAALDARAQWKLQFAHGDSPMPTETAPPPEHPFQHITRNVNKIVEQMHKGYYNFRPTDTWAPNVNLYETEDLYLVCVDLAGVEKEKIDVELADNRLSIRGARGVPSYDDVAEDSAPKHAASQASASPPAERGKLRVHVLEIDHGPFFREVELPDHVHRERIAAHYRNGMLWIEIPKK
jgi:HSP20 family protein